MIRRLDHIAIAVRDTEASLAYFRDQLGLEVIAVDHPPEVPVKLTYLDAGNVYLQLIEPLSETSAVCAFLDEHGEGLHHICFGVDDVVAELTKLGSNGSVEPLASGRGRPAGFLPAAQHGVRIECTQFDFHDDVEEIAGWLQGDDRPPPA